MSDFLFPEMEPISLINHNLIDYFFEPSCISIPPEPDFDSGLVWIRIYCVIGCYLGLFDLYRVLDQ